MDKEYSVQDIVDTIPGKISVLGTMDRRVSRPSDINNLEENAITFCKRKDASALEIIKQSKAKVIICYNELDFTNESYNDKTLILVKNPRLAFIKVIQKFFENITVPNISKNAIINEKANLHKSVSVGDFSYIGECKIGKGTIVHENVQIYSNVDIGDNVTIHAGTTIGSQDAFAYERDENGELIQFPHFGGVVIGDNVDIHVHVNIDRGTFGNTIIGRGTKINRYAHIGHNSVIGKHCQIGGQVFIAGSSSIGDYCELALCSCVRNGTTLGDNVFVGMGSVVVKDVEDDWIVYGVPAKKIRKNKIPPWRTAISDRKIF